MISAGSATRRVRRWTLLPWLVLAIGILASFLLFAFIRDAIENVARLRFERQSNNAHSIIENRLHFYVDVLYALKAMFASQDQVSRLRFHRFATSLDLKHRYPGFDAVNFAAYVTDREKKRFENAVRLDTSLDPRGYPQFAIKPSGERGEYHVLVYLEPMAGYEFAFGVDISANPAQNADPQSQRAVQQYVRDSGHLTASGIPIRVKTPDKEYTGLAMRLRCTRTTCRLIRWNNDAQLFSGP